MISTNFQLCTEIEDSSLKLTRIQTRKNNNFVVPLCRFYYTAASCVGSNLNILPRSPCAACAFIKMSAMKHTVHHVYLHEYTQYEHGILHIFTSSSDREMPVPWQEPEIPVVLLPSVGVRARVPASCVRAAWCRRRVEAEQYIARICLKS